MFSRNFNQIAGGRASGASPRINRSKINHRHHCHRISGTTPNLVRLQKMDLYDYYCFIGTVGQGAVQRVVQYKYSRLQGY